MKKIFLIFQIFILFFIHTALADIKIAYIDMDNIMSASIAGKSILKQLNDKNNKIILEFQKSENSFIEQEKKIIDQKNILSDVEFKEKFKILKSEFKEYTKMKKKKIDYLNQLKTDNTNKFVKQINEILMKYSVDRSISLILDKKKIIMGKSELDISMDIIKIVNLEIKKFKVK